MPKIPSPLTFHPFRQVCQEPQLVVVWAAVALQGDVQEQVAVLANDVDQFLDHGVRGAVGRAAVVMPVADAGVGLPGIGLDGVGAAAFEIVHQVLVELPRRMGVIDLGVVDHVQLALPPRHVGVAVVRDNAHPGVAQRRHRVVEVQQVRPVLVDQVLRAVEPFLDVGLAGLGRAGCAVGTVQIGRVVALPPAAFAVGLGQRAVIRNARERSGGIGPVGNFIPLPRAGAVHAHAEPQPVPACGFRPNADDVFLGADIDRVPGLVPRIPAVEIAVVIGQRHEVLGPRPLVEPDQLLGIPLLGLPQVADVLVAELRGVAVVLDMVLVIAAALLVHVEGVPIALFGLALGTPVGPDAEFCVAEPLGALVLPE